MIRGSVARRYAAALLQVARARGQVDPLGAELEALARAFESGDEVRRALTSPMFPPSRQRAALQALARALGVSDAVANLALVLHERNRVAALPAVAREYHALADAAAGRVRAQVTSARPLEDAERERVHAALTRATGRTVVMETAVDPELIGGLVARVGSTLYDGSVRARLHELRENLLGQH